ncbi:MAG: SOS response-associated peptidase [Arthrobacter sp.]|uniref:SOS response-associated peptidase n=1 Tax=Arthrobacter sp. TaxID=1667 RepID=UPI003480DC35
MCGRYVMARARGDLLAAAEAEADEALEVRRSWNVAPTSDVPIVLERLVEGRVARQLHTARWGLVPGWAREPSVGVRAINARSETVLDKPTFRGAVRSRRCAVPADGYYEWKSAGGGKRGGRPYFVRPADGSVLLFAGLYEWWRDASVRDGDPGQWLLTTSVLTMDAPPADAAEPVLAQLAGLHDRMPIPLGPAGLAGWLDPLDTDAPPLVARARAAAYGVAAAWELGEAHPGVGNVRNDGPELLEPADGLF